ncbi:putative MFS-type transporter C18.02 [Pseudocercospora fuligena]|uniref:Putative MFS-type transporter C18.02 n=1 Tax=Pseudocercospora fuligena TaxID=685502 RepID=A0A8H6RKY4_9PEZI|nr:putative MFS-type transporter C18.02 [Pseudocercospora fuligena]
MASTETKTVSSHSWRYSKTLLIFTATLGLFTENFLYGFVVPILPYMIEKRLRLDPSYTQRFTTELLFVLGLISMVSAPIIGHLADQTTSRKIPLLLSLIGCTVGTLLVATTPSVWAMYVGRILQGMAGTGAWIVGFGMLTDAAGKQHQGKALGIAGSFITAGIITGPAVAGALLEWIGYWPAWTVPLTLLAIDFIARLAMADQPAASRTAKSDARPRSESHGPSEDEPLLQDSSNDNDESKRVASQGFYSIMFRQGKTYAAIFNVIAFSTILSGFDATLPVHLRDAFGWGPAPIGSIFLGLQIPAMCLAPFVGWLRDRIGLKWPTTIGWALTAPLLWFAGVPGDADFLGIGSDARGQGTFVACIISIGIVWSFVRGAGTFQLTAVLHDLRETNPNIFGPGGGSSRMFSLTEVSFSTGLMLGPLICGSLADTVGFYWTSCFMAATSAFVAVTSFLFFTHNPVWWTLQA